MGNCLPVLMFHDSGEQQLASSTFTPRSQSASSGVIGFDKERESILDRLQRGSSQLQIVSIVGMAGIGKTTLATQVFNDPSISYRFPARAWCPISQALNRYKVLVDLLEQIDPAKLVDPGSEHDLADRLRRSLKGRRYLIFLDDMWNTESWNDLKDSFPDDTTGSRILLTSRSADVAPRGMLDQEPLSVSPLSTMEGLELVKTKLFPGNGTFQLNDLGMKIVERCKGLPLAIILLAGLLETVEPGDWDKILDSFSFVLAADNCRHTLELSYMHLPDYLRPCFLYFGVFPEDHEIQVRRLLRLWIAEGFIQKSETNSKTGQSLEDVAEGYLKTLISRSLIMVAKQRCDGGVKTCRIHDLLREFCLQKARDEHFFRFLKVYDESSLSNEPHNSWTLCIDSEPEHLSNGIGSHVRSLHFNIPWKWFTATIHMLHLFEHLKVLDLEQVSFHMVFPDEIGQLTLLAFLAIRGNFLEIPLWLGIHTNLETFICIQDSGDLVTLPIGVCNMKRLRYLYLRGRFDKVCFRFCGPNLEKSTVSYELDRLSGVTMHKSSMELALRMFPNLRKLKCEIYEDRYDDSYGEVLIFPDLLWKLETLHISNRYANNYNAFDFTSLVNLKKLSLASVKLEKDALSTISDQLPNLEILKLHELGFITGEYTWEMKEGEFSKVRILHLSRMYIDKWIACDDYQFESIEKLVLKDWELEELPCCLESAETLELIELDYCDQRLVNMANKIEQVQHSEWGNLGMKTITHRTRYRNLGTKTPLVTESISMFNFLEC